VGEIEIRFQKVLVGLDFCDISYRYFVILCGRKNIFFIRSVILVIYGAIWVMMCVYVGDLIYVVNCSNGRSIVM
jgi:hypothetical protein